MITFIYSISFNEMRREGIGEYLQYSKKIIEEWKSMNDKAIS